MDEGHQGQVETMTNDIRHAGSGFEATTIRDILQKLKYPVGVKKTGFTTRFGEDSSGEPAVWIRFVLDHELKDPSPRQLETLTGFSRTVRSKILESQVTRWPYVEFTIGR